MRKRLLVTLAFVIALIGSSQSSVYLNTQDQQIALSKIAPWVLERAANGQTAEFLIIMADQADLSRAETLRTKREKGRFVYQTLYNKAQQTQGQVLAWLKSQGIEHRSYYIINMVWARGTLDTALALAARSDVARIDGNPLVKNELPQIEPLPDQPSEPLAVEPNINFVRAPEVWNMGFTGQGIVVAGADTGIRWDHDALKAKYRGFNGVNASHDFNWHDSIHSGGGSCGANANAPCDDHGHGTHTIGTAIGDDGISNQVGMAPGAKWIGCRNMNQGFGTPATYIECMEFFLAPYPIGGTPAQGDPDKAPDVSVNSWGCPPSEGCVPDSLKAAVEAQRAAGIMMVVSAGNSGGAGCSSVVDPPAIYDASYTVGSFSHVTGNIAGSSSKGPVTIDGSNRMKPDITAPGVNVRSSTRTSTSSYGNLSGTSMAGPHVAGAVALLWSAQPALKNHVGFTENLLNIAAVDVASTLCDVSGGVPNNVYGHGRLDIKAAVDLAIPCTSVPTVSRSSESYPAAAATDSVLVTAATGCNWTASSDSPGFITINSGSSGSGFGTVNFSISENTTPSPRTGTLTIAGQTFTVFQGAAFLDVPQGHPFYTEIGKLSARGVTLGCNGMNYCPDDDVTRDQMAAFIIRALGDFNPPTPQFQRFVDVPPSNPFYAFIEQMAVRQITLGCGGPIYCPSDPVLRDQMAAFIIRGLGEFNPPVPPFQRFLDVPPSQPFYRFIDRMAVLQITLGCGSGNYCPGLAVSRGQMAAFLVRAYDL